MKQEKQFKFQIGAYDEVSKLITHYAFNIDTIKELIQANPKDIKQVLINLIDGNELMSKQYSEQFQSSSQTENAKSEELAEVEVEVL